LIIVVWLSVPISVSGYAHQSPPRCSAMTTGEKRSRLIWCRMPWPSGTISTLLKARLAQSKNSKRSAFCRRSSAMFCASARGLAASMTLTEWSITRCTGTLGLTRAGSPPRSATASRSAARSTSAGVPSRSWRMTRAGK
jgi:hypothetical protein